MKAFHYKSLRYKNISTMKPFQTNFPYEHLLTENISHADECSSRMISLERTVRYGRVEVSSVEA